MKYNYKYAYKTVLLFVCFFSVSLSVYSQAPSSFVHPGGLHTISDLERMKQKVLANEKPWIDGWNLMINDFKGKSTYVAKTFSDIGGKNGERQQAVRDADAAYFNALQWYVTGNTANADCAVRILNAWANDLKSANGELFMLPIPHMIEAAEVLRIYNGWSSVDIDKFKGMCRNIFYPACKNFLGECGSWSGWDGPANAAILEMGVFLDDPVMFNEAVLYFKEGTGGAKGAKGGGYIKNMVCQPSGQISEMGRDQPHALIGPAFTANMCQFAWNQGVDLFGYDDNRLLKGFEYFCKFNLNNEVDWIPFNDCKNNNFYFLSDWNKFRIYNNPVLELVYNHYKEFKGIEATYTKTMINLAGIVANNDDNLGYKALTYTLPNNKDVFNKQPIPSAPTQLKASAGITKVFLNWNKPTESQASGYTVYRSTNSGGPYSVIATWNNNTATSYIDATVSNEVTYFYKVSANNQSGEGNLSSEVTVKPVAASLVLPQNWILSNIGINDSYGAATYANVENRSFVVSSYGNLGIGGTADSNTFIHTNTSGDFVLTAKFSDGILTTKDSDKFGLMVRETLDVDAKMSAITSADTETRKVWFVNRAVTAGNTPWVSGDTHTRIPSWFRIERVGNTFTAYQSRDGIVWSKVSSANIGMSNNAFAGIFVSAGMSGVSNSIIFDNISITGTGFVLPATPTNFSGSPISSSKINLSWTSVNSALYYSLLRSKTSDGDYDVIANNLTNTAYEDVNLDANTKYFYKVKAVNFSGESVVSNVINVTTNSLSIPKIPTGFVAVSGNLNVVLSWDKTDEASKYIIKRSSTYNGTYETIAETSSLNYIDTTVTGGLIYYYKLIASNEVGNGNETQIKSVKIKQSEKFRGNIIGTLGSYNGDVTKTREAAMDENLSTFFDATIATGAWVGLDLGEGTVGIPTEVRYAPRSGYPNRMLGGKFEGANKSDFSDAQVLYTVGELPSTGIITQKSVLATQKFRYFRFVSPTEGWGNVAEIEFWGNLDGDVPLPPLGLVGIVSSSTEINLTWLGDSKVTNYILERSVNDNLSFQTIASNITSTTYKDSNLLPNTTYYYRLKSVNSHGESDYSISVNLKTTQQGTPIAPKNFVATNSKTGIVLNWDSSNGAINYKIQRSLSIDGVFEAIATVSSLNYVDQNIMLGTTYYYKVIALNSIGSGGETDIVSIESKVPFSLPNNNFSIETKGETCSNQNNGVIYINATENHTYKASINNVDYSFNGKQLMVSNLKPGKYSLCITVVGEAYEQCYSVQIAEASVISARSTFSDDKLSVDMLSGTAPYQVWVNGYQQLETEASSFSVEAKKGDVFEIKSAKLCEGTYKENLLDFISEVNAYPNPTDGLFQLRIPTSRSEVDIALFDLNSRLLLKKAYSVTDNTIFLDIQNQPSGVYIVEVFLEVPKRFKIIKK